MKYERYSLIRGHQDERKRFHLCHVLYEVRGHILASILLRLFIFQDETAVDPYHPVNIDLIVRFVGYHDNRLTEFPVQLLE